MKEDAQFTAFLVEIEALHKSLAAKDRELAESYASHDEESRQLSDGLKAAWRERDKWKARAERARLIVAGSRMAECHIGPLFGAGWNGCIEHLEKQIDAAISAQEAPAK